MGDDGARFRPGATAQREEGVQPTGGERSAVGEDRTVEESFCFQGRQVENEIADGDADMRIPPARRRKTP